MKYLVVTGIVLAIFILILVIEALLARRGPWLPFQNPSSDPVSFGQNKPALRLLVIGDSTAAGEGANYQEGIAIAAAQHLAQKGNVELVNLAVSGAKAKDVARSQLPKVAGLKPDVILISVGANDVTHLSRPGAVRKSLGQVIEGLVAINCQTKIVVTAAPDMGSIPRFAQPLRFVAGMATKRLNKPIYRLVENKQLTLAPIALDTGPVFRRNPSLYGIDRFHPNAEGYKVWSATINKALDEALASQPSHCPQYHSYQFSAERRYEW